MDYVVIDATALANFFSMVKNAIGTTVTVILPVFGILLSFSLVIYIVRRFTH